MLRESYTIDDLKAEHKVSAFVSKRKGAEFKSR